MTNKVVDIGNIKNYSDKTFFFDCNAWIKCICPYVNPESISNKAYSGAYYYILKKSNNKIAFNDLLLSEYSNYVLRRAFKMFLAGNGYFEKDFPFKKYRTTSDYKETLKIIQDQLNNYFFSNKHMEYTGSLNKESVHSLISENMDKVDYNDSYYSKICIENSYILVTDDLDFINLDNLNILTANNKYFKK